MAKIKNEGPEVHPVVRTRLEKEKVNQRGKDHHPDQGLDQNPARIKNLGVVVLTRTHLDQVVVY